MITPQVVNELEMYLGASFIYHFQWWDYELNKPQNLTRCRIDIAFRPAIHYELAFLRISTDDFIFIENPVEGMFTIYLPAELTSLIDYKLYKRAYFDCVVSKGDYSYNIMSGKVTMNLLATRPDTITKCEDSVSGVGSDYIAMGTTTTGNLSDKLLCKEPNYATGISLPNILINGVDIGCRNCSTEYVNKLITDGILTPSDLNKLAFIPPSAD